VDLYNSKEVSKYEFFKGAITYTVMLSSIQLTINRKVRSYR